jgi:uncharacterized protein
MVKVPEIVRALLLPDAYPQPVSRVEFLQTGISLIFLTDDFAYKVKKPVKYDFLDFSTVEKRRHYCEREVVLNRRLCPDVYLGVANVTKEQDTIRIDGQGKVMDYAVKMRRLPQKDMMDVRLGNNDVTPDMVRSISQILANFHNRTMTSPEISANGNLSVIDKNTDENFTETAKYIEKTISKKFYENIKKYTEAIINNSASLFEKRVSDGYIRDCHGDLHASNICISDNIYIYDCIEFNDRFRYSDVASEVAFLAMDLDHYGRADLSSTFVDEYVKESHDADLRKLLDFYKCYRAYVRGKIKSFEIDDTLISPVEKRRAKNEAQSYFDLAMSYTKPGPWLLITVGLTGTGKSTTAHALASRLGLTVISSDLVRKNITGVAPTEHRYVSFNNNIYSPDITRQTYDALFARAKDILKENGKVIIDASFIRQSQRIIAKSLAEEMNARFFVLEFSLDEENLRKRLLERESQGTVSDGRWEIYLAQQKEFNGFQGEDIESILIDSTKPIDVIVREAVEKIISKI